MKLYVSAHSETHMRCATFYSFITFINRRLQCWWWRIVYLCS